MSFKAQQALVVVFSMSLLAMSPQFGLAKKFAVTGDSLAQEDTPFFVYGYNNDLAEKGVLVKSTDSLEVALQGAAEYVSTNANKGGRAEIIAYTQTPMKKLTITLEKPRKKDFKEEKKSGGGARAKTARVSLMATTWVGSESASDTTSLTLVFKDDGTAIAYDDTRFTWKGTWRMVGEKNVIIQLTVPNAVTYSGQIDGKRITGKAGRPGGRGQWTWSVQQR